MQDNYIDTMRADLLEIVETYLSPVAVRYGYSDVPLESNIKWRPQVLILGNYSSGKSTLINEFLGVDVQKTGQAPTDDSFTVITYGDPNEDDPDQTTIRVLEERDGKYLLNDPEYPFATMKKHGQRFISHFKMKRINSPFLQNLALIDTPGMLDSITEQDRGYNYQEVIGDLAQIADLVLIMFDPHKAGTVREAHISLRDTLPNRAFEDHILFVLNRIDECSNLNDLLRVYGTLCWNLSQMTGRKDIPMIHLTWSQRAMMDYVHKNSHTPGFLEYLENQRDDLKRAILQAPHYRLDNLAAFVETHAERLAHLLEALISYRKRGHLAQTKNFLAGVALSLLGGVLGVGSTMLLGLPLFQDPATMLIGTGSLAGILMFFWLSFFQGRLFERFHQKQLNTLDELTPLENQTRKDCWQAVKACARSYLIRTKGRFGLNDVKTEYNTVCVVRDKWTREIREALNELTTIAKPQSAACEVQREPEYVGGVGQQMF